MKTTARSLVSAAALVCTAGLALATPPQYTIVDIGLANVAHTASQGVRVSPAGVATGRSLGTSALAYSWTQSGGIVALPNLITPARNFSQGNGANDNGQVVGTGTTTSFGSNPLPLIWQNGTVTQLALAAGQTLGRANDINASGVIVGSMNSGSSERGAIFSTSGPGSFITTTTASGCFLVVAYAVNDSGMVGGIAWDPANAARNVGFIYDSVANTAIEVGALPGLNGAIVFDVSNAGHATGSSMLNQGSGLPFVWTAGGGMVAIPLPTGASQASGRGVNSSGWVVGNASAATSTPFLYDGAQSYRLGDLLPAGSGWDLLTGTSNSALGISDNGIIVGTGLHNGAVRAYAMIPVVPCYPNCDASTTAPVLNVQDFSCFLNSFAAGETYANCDNSTEPPVLNVQDFSCFLNAFAAGCN